MQGKKSWLPSRRPHLSYYLPGIWLRWVLRRPHDEELGRCGFTALLAAIAQPASEYGSLQAQVYKSTIQGCSRANAASLPIHLLDSNASVETQ